MLYDRILRVAETLGCDAMLGLTLTGLDEQTLDTAEHR